MDDLRSSCLTPLFAPVTTETVRASLGIYSLFDLSEDRKTGVSSRLRNIWIRNDAFEHGHSLERPFQTGAFRGDRERLAVLGHFVSSFSQHFPIGFRAGFDRVRIELASKRYCAWWNALYRSAIEVDDRAASAVRNDRRRTFRHCLTVHDAVRYQEITLVG